MRQQFLRIYIGVALVVFLGVFAVLFMTSRAFDAARRSGFEERMFGTVRSLRDRAREALQDTVRGDLMFEALREYNRLPIQLEQMDEAGLSEEEKKYLREDEAAVVSLGDPMRFYAALSDEQVLVVGPFPPRPGRGSWSGRGFWRWFLWPPEVFFLWMLAAVLLLVGLAIYFLIRPLERRVYALSDVARRFGQGDLESRAQVEQGDAIAELAGTFNWMADRIKGLVDRQKELLRAVSHEFRTPLARLFFAVDEAQMAGAPEEKDQYLRRIEGSLNELNDLVEELLTFVRLEGESLLSEVGPVEVGAIIREMPDVVADLRGDLKVEVLCGDQQVVAMPRYLKRAVQNLVTNAVRHAKSGVWITCSDEDKTVRISVDDDGPGVPEKDRERVFEPFARLDESRSAKIGGTGLGLAIVQRVMSLHGGQVELEDSPRGGARFTLVFPGRRKGSEQEASVSGHVK